jgi:hypothetical protein
MTERSRVVALEWRGIESAPKDGTRFLAWCPSTRLALMEIRGITSETWSLTGQVKHPEPTHWMPFPDPPKPAKNSIPASKWRDQPSVGH